MSKFNDNIKFQFLENGNILIQEDNKGLIKEKEVKLADFYNLLGSLMQSVSTNKIYNSSMIYTNKDNVEIIQTLIKDEKNFKVILKRNKAKAPFIIGTRALEIEYPTLLFVVNISAGIFTNLAAFCVIDKQINEKSIIYKYPFSNVYADGKVCLGNNKLQISWRDSDAILKIPNLFFSMSNTLRVNGNSNSKGYDLNLLLEYIINKDCFEDELLVEDDKALTYKELIDDLSKKH